MYCGAVCVLKYVIRRHIDNDDKIKRVRLITNNLTLLSTFQDFQGLHHLSYIRENKKPQN